MMVQVSTAPRLADELFVPLVLTNFVTLAKSSPGNCGHAINKLCLKQDIGVGEHAILQRHHHELQREFEQGNLIMCLITATMG